MTGVGGRANARAQIRDLEGGMGMGPRIREDKMGKWVPVFGELCTTTETHLESVVERHMP